MIDFTHFGLTVTYGALGEVFAACLVAIGAKVVHHHHTKRKRPKPHMPPHGAVHKKPAPRKRPHK